MKDHCIILEHGTLMEYDRNMFGSLEKLCFHNQNCYFDVFLISYFHYWTLIIKLVLSRFE